MAEASHRGTFPFAGASGLRRRPATERPGVKSDYGGGIDLSISRAALECPRSCGDHTLRPSQPGHQEQVPSATEQLPLSYQTLALSELRALTPSLVGGAGQALLLHLPLGSKI
jgi:hypothetical protein